MAITDLSILTFIAMAFNYYIVYRTNKIIGSIIFIPIAFMPLIIQTLGGVTQHDLNTAGYFAVIVGTGATISTIYQLFKK